MAGETTALQAWINSTTTTLTGILNRMTAVEGVNATQKTDITLLKTQVGGLLTDVSLLKSQVATLLAGTPPPPPVGLPPPPQVQWSAGMEAGSLLVPTGEWDDKTNSGSADSVAITAAAAGIPPRGGLWVMKQSVTGAVGGTRMARYKEIVALTKAGTPFYWSWWDFFPSKITYGPADMFSIWQIASVDSAGVPSPIWTLNTDGVNFTPTLIWSPNDMAGPGPHSGETGKRAYSSTMVVPVGQWVFFEVYIKPAADFTGALKVWLNTVPLFDLTGVRTRFADSAAGAAIPMYVTHNAYGSGLTPTPAVHYVDDVSLSLNRMTYP